MLYTTIPQFGSPIQGSRPLASLYIQQYYTPRLQHDQLQHFLLIPIHTDISTLVSGTGDIVHILHNLIPLFLVLKVDGRPVSDTLGKNPRLYRISSGIAVNCGFFFLA
jgi:hypothetical protein